MIRCYLLHLTVRPSPQYLLVPLVIDDVAADADADASDIVAGVVVVAAAAVALERLLDETESAVLLS